MPERDPRLIPPEIENLIHWTARKVYRRCVWRRVSDGRVHVSIGLVGLVGLVDLLDLAAFESKGILGWLDALEDYDETRNSSLVAFARPYVHRRMMSYIRKNAKICALIRGTAKRVYEDYVKGRASSGRIGLDDLEHEGLDGWRNAPDYDETRNSSREAFAWRYVYGRMMDYIRKHSAKVRLPQKPWAQVKALEEAKWAIRKAGEEPTTEKLATNLG